MKMKSLTSHRYAGRRLSAGETFEASRRDARVLTAVGHAKVEHDAPVAVAVAPPAPEPVVVAVLEAPAEEAPKRRRRKTEETTEEPVPAEPAAEPVEPTRLRRFFERRDMQAEDTKE